MSNVSGLTVQDFRTVAPANAQRVIDAINVAASKVSVVCRPGGVASGNVYTSFADALAALNQHAGFREMVFDDSLSSPIVIPAGTWQTDDIVFSGRFDFTSGNNVQVHFADGAKFSQLCVAQFGLDLRSLSTSAVLTASNGQPFMLLENGANVISELGAAPFIDVPATMTDTFVLLLSVAAGLGAAGQHALQIDAPAQALVVLEAYAILQTNVISGTGTVTVSIDAASVEGMTPLPISQPNVGTLVVADMISAPHERYTPGTPANWAAPAPTVVQSALDRIAAAVVVLRGGPIP